MPKRLAADARRIHDKVKAEGRLTDLLYYARQLAHVVYLDQSHSAQSAALVQVSEDISARFDILSLSDMAGMMLTGGAKGGPKRAEQQPFTLTIKLLGGKSGLWCSGCPHGEGKVCFLDPTNDKPFPPWLHLNIEKKKAYLKGRTTNARTAGVKCLYQYHRRRTLTLSPTRPTVAALVAAAMAEARAAGLAVAAVALPQPQWRTQMVRKSQQAGPRSRQMTLQRARRHHRRWLLCRRGCAG